MDARNTLLIEDLQEQIKRLEARLTGIETHERSDSLHDGAAGDAEQEDSSIGGYKRNYDEETNHRRFIPEVRRCNFMGFKNRFAEDDGYYAVDVLESGILLDQEIQLEQSLRDRLGNSGGKSNSRAARRKANAIVKEANHTNEALCKAQSDDIWVRRIRIQSPALLRIFAKIQGETWSSRPRVYYRPFCPLIYYFPQFRRVLRELEQRWGTHVDVTPVDTPGRSVGYEGEEMDEGEEVEEAIDDGPSALAVLRCFVEFLEKDIIPESTKFEDLDYSHDAKIRFSDLCYLFKIGDIVYRPVEGEITGHRDSRMGQRAWRVHHADFSSERMQSLSSDRHLHPGPDVNGRGYKIESFCIEYTGDELCAVTNSFTISPYQGLRPVNSLPVFPLRFVPDNKNFFKLAVEVGDRTLQAIETKHGIYNGWTVIRNSKGGFVTDSHGIVQKHSEHVNSEVMVDFGEAFAQCPSWKPERAVLKAENANQIMVTDAFNIRWWSGPDRYRLKRESNEITPHRTGIHTSERNKFVSEDPFLVAESENHRLGQHTTQRNLLEEDKILVACRVFAYIFRERKFAQLDVQRLKPSTQSRDALNSLRIPQQTKDLIEGSIRGHFIQKEAEKRNGEEGLSLDVIQGKGTGLFILLHGVPGVGKTATAEAVAQANGKPLFKITVGDLGLTPDQVESSLRHIFRLASNWDCILLMDEVDTFFSQRSKGDAAMTKNALVSVFLRILDYYGGILFLTTNRAGALDEAFKSRIHYKLYFAPLSKEQTLDIWKLNIQRLRQLEEQCKERRPLQFSESAILKFAEDQFNSNKKSTGQWNGRQIRNAFQVARSLALFEAAEDAAHLERNNSDVTPTAILDVRHFFVMHDITESFDLYMEEIYSGMNDADLARELEHRADHWKNNQRARKVKPLEDYGDRHGSNEDRRSPFERPSSQGFITRPRSTSNRESRPSLSIPVPTQRYPSNSLLRTVDPGYDETAADDPGTEIFPPISPTPGQRRQSKPIESFEGDQHYDRGSNDNQKIAAGSGFDFRLLGRGNGGYSLGRDNRRENNFEFDSNYKRERNEFGKRERD